MKATPRPRELGGSFKSRSRHGAQLSISDTNHHVTEAIGDMYGDDDDWKRESRPLSFISSPLNQPPESDEAYFSNSNWTTEPLTGRRNAGPRPQLQVNGGPAGKSHTLPAAHPSHRNAVIDVAPPSTSHSLRDGHSIADTANQQFPLDDIDYESNPAAVAQELSNLQALRRMSMDVGNTSDPDLPSFQGRPVMPSVAPTGGDDEDDPSRLFWVPARVHPELAPMEFKSFLETRVKTIKRRSGDSTLVPDILERSGSASSLRRKKSMLSRQIDNSGGKGGLGYQDGADKLERRRSLLSQGGNEIKISDLTELDELVKDPARAFQKLSMERGKRDDTGAEVPADEDMPILPAAPGFGLRRSTHTTYRKGSLRRGERVPYSKRAGARQADADGDDPFISQGVKRVMSEPVSENFSRPNRRRGPTIEDKDSDQIQGSKYKLTDQSVQFGEETLSQTESHRSDVSLPQIIETPPEDEQPSEEPLSPTHHSFPERSSSFNQPQAAEQPLTQPPPRSSRRPGVARQVSSIGDAVPKSSKANLVNELTQSSSPLPGSSSRTDSLTFIPTVVKEKKPEVKTHKDRERDKDDNESNTPKKGWGWFKGSDDKNKKEKKKDDESSKKSKAKVSLEKTHDVARLDVLQHSIESNAQRGRESLHQERESFENKLGDERKKESSRKSGKEEKKEKDGLFSSLFGGKKKGERDSGGKKSASLRALSPDPPRHLRPDVDYNWTSFSLLEERAIYRMAHIKLANPRRPLHSQVLLSNFMYAYLAKVQQMHPHVQVPQSAAQKKAQEAERKAKEAERRQEEEQQQSEQYRYDYHQGIANYADSPSDQQQQQQHHHQQRHHQQQQHDGSETVTYVDDSQIYDYDHQDDGGGHNQPRQASRRQGGDDYSQSGQGQYSHQQYYQYDNQQQGAYDHDKDGEMW
ncbi:hypothetical protein VC83_01500 [Pseudogymnoascus destructans]|uniref:Protein Zds1 C-terminal domain-containing protein n=2 Tax=Pseudogymnoascus destructans TaxID=655981 RepID=L8G2F6_PSED2|nr:uncharacterized protein VC83_01500 [Pseudogymnoascus destructans]ELR06131.1 hypothetical protein GMDG_02005 [Pseudogymnoascus destructans 20631-21]OAF62007.1 hypothetical protein VC83_01500 [Pseudogymnoascus destructans]